MILKTITTGFAGAVGVVAGVAAGALMGKVAYDGYEYTKDKVNGWAQDREKRASERAVMNEVNQAFLADYRAKMDAIRAANILGGNAPVQQQQTAA
jgi:hypothetical protein